MKILLVHMTFSTLLHLAHASSGDRSPVHRQCVDACSSANCSTTAALDAFHAAQPTPERILQWSCQEECKYQCMWQTVDRFHAEGFPTPQFHGKWPFVRLLGVQEPASALFSLLNLLPHVAMLQRLLRRGVDPSAPMMAVWTLYGLVSCNTWFWSTVFHSRDNDFTEMMDYFCAFSVVAFSLLAFFIRLLGSNSWKSILASLACVLGFLWHVYNMAFVHFDYGYNMVVNISVGGLNSVCWLAWALWHWKTHAHVWKAVAAVLMLNFTVLLELLDFAPILWTFDSHSLWHLSTAPVHIAWYCFVMDDCKFLMNTSGKDKKIA